MMVERAKNVSTPTSTKTTEYAHIVCTPGVMGGEPRIDRYRIRVRDIVAARDVDGSSPHDIVRHVYPFLTLAEVYAALAYYEDHKDEIDALERADDEFVERFLRENPERVVDMRPKDAS
jgi:uncharacterized protein (DUF433 family)